MAIFPHFWAPLKQTSCCRQCWLSSFRWRLLVKVVYATKSNQNQSQYITAWILHKSSIVQVEEMHPPLTLGKIQDKMGMPMSYRTAIHPPRRQQPLPLPRNRKNRGYSPLIICHEFYPSIKSGFRRKNAALWSWGKPQRLIIEHYNSLSFLSVKIFCSIYWSKSKLAKQSTCQNHSIIKNSDNGNLFAGKQTRYQFTLVAPKISSSDVKLQIVLLLESFQSGVCLGSKKVLPRNKKVPAWISSSRIY